MTILLPLLPLFLPLLLSLLLPHALSLAHHSSHSQHFLIRAAVTVTSVCVAFQELTAVDDEDDEDDEEAALTHNVDDKDFRSREELHHAFNELDGYYDTDLGQLDDLKEELEKVTRDLHECQMEN